jgi:hypothetical protein
MRDLSAESGMSVAEITKAVSRVYEQILLRSI